MTTTPLYITLAIAILAIGSDACCAQDIKQPNHPDFRGKEVRCPEGYRLHYQGMCVNIADEEGNKPNIRGAKPQIIKKLPK